MRSYRPGGFQCSFALAALLTSFSGVMANRTRSIDLRRLRKNPRGTTSFAIGARSCAYGAWLPSRSWSVFQQRRPSALTTTRRRKLPKLN